MIIGITGFAGSGKNTAASMINFILNGYSFEDWGSEWTKHEPWGLTRLRQYKENQQKGINNEQIISATKEYIRVGDLKIFFEEKSFADKVKQVCSILTGIPREDWDKRELRDVELPIEGLFKPTIIEEGVYDKETKEEYSVTELPNYTYRTFMQRVGTEAMRDNIHQNVGINALMVDYKCLDDSKRRTDLTTIDYSECPFPNWIITDVRFENEVKAIKDRGGIILKITRGDSVAIPRTLHPSESGIIYINEDFSIGNNGTLEQLWNNVKVFTNTLNL